MRVNRIGPVLVLLAGTALLGLGQAPLQTEEGTFSIYFRDEKVGFEEYTWREDERGITLEVRGRMTKPVRMEIEALTIRMDRGFIPEYFHFKGEVSGVRQEIVSEISEGRVESVIRVSGQEQTIDAEVRRDAVLLPNPIYSSYMVITKRFRCGLSEALDLSAYIIPQIETPFTLGPDEVSSCLLIMQMGAARIELQTDSTGSLRELAIPSQDLRVVRDE